MTDVLGRIDAGLGDEGDLDTLLDIADNVGGKCFCPLGDASLGFMVSAIKHFRGEFERHVQEHRCPMGAKLYDTVNH